ncbi:hypothetical protein M406DRAFT_331814 [Cryphonectria parasitica EP155]|uniref:Protein kinase domain-containing protein n=1 Tax=Cryphonectria parasitica (strain ATCC 38755 / EP155) TaxID=660469 RepID=A0A9P5CMV5_CRYP1|nr:uncharacterized protein M406DRAFT_331814 [Cryphonectria parasitica EP155]KAF3763280.1 hypothetical protein M406DRAFT_331814 [Cryphonectria parasitica EP155]
MRRWAPPNQFHEIEAAIQGGKFGIMPAFSMIGFRLKKVLGQGGYGCAALLQMEDINGQSHKVVVKAALGPTSLGPEIDNMRPVMGKRLKKFPLTKRDVLINKFNTLATHLAMEYAPYGDLKSVIYEARERRTRLRSQDLWMIFHCYVLHPHTTVPVIKIGDLGLSKTFTVADRMDWEQFTKDWNYLDRSPYPLEPVAGNYDWWSNVYAVGLCMWQLVTSESPSVPPECSKETFSRPDGTDFEAWTYGGYLLTNEFDYQDLELRRTIAQCMANQPSDRPTLTELEKNHFIDTQCRHYRQD